jgi:hypothetical protein
MADDKYYTGAAPLDQVIADLQRRLSVLEQMPRLQNAAINAGALRVIDASGNVRVVIGLLPDGTYGLQVREDPSVPLHNVPAVFSSFIATGETSPGTSYGDLATPGPIVTVPVGASGRILVIATAQIQWNTSLFASPVGDGRFDVAFTGANTRNPNEVSDLLVGIFRLSSGNNAGSPISGIAGYGTFTAQAVFSSLNPGSTTITMKYRNETDNNASPVQFFRRTLTVVTL